MGNGLVWALIKVKAKAKYMYKVEGRVRVTCSLQSDISLFSLLSLALAWGEWER
jgi:hypothetical protein